MTINELNFQLENAVKNIIRSLGYYKSGKLIDSIKFDCRLNSNGSVDIKYTSVDYIQYVGDGKILDAIGQSTEIVSILEKFYVDYINTKLFK